MSAPTTHGPRERALKIATRALVEACGGFEAAALCVRVGKTQLAAYASLNEAAFMPLDIILQLEEIARGGPFVLPVLARILGCEAVAVPDVSAPSTDVMGALVRVSHEQADVLTATADHLRAGTPESIAQAAKEIDEAVNALMALRKQVEVGICG